MKRIFPLLVGLLLSATFGAPGFAEEPQVAMVPAPTVTPAVTNKADDTGRADAVPQAETATTSKAEAPKAEEVNLLLIFPVQEPLKRPQNEAPDEATIAAAAAAGEVWVNAKSKIYHVAGTTYYGKTKAGFFLPEAQAIEQGYRGVKD